MSSPVVKSDKRRPGTPDIIVTRHLVLKSQLIFQHSMMERTPSEQTQSTRPPVFSKNGKAESPKPEMMAAWECSQSPCPDLVSGRVVARPGFVSRGLSCKPCVHYNERHKTTLWGPRCQPAFLCSLWGARPACSWPHPHSFAALQLQGLSQGCWFSLPLTLAWFVLSSLTRTAFHW